MASRTVRNPREVQKVMDDLQSRLEASDGLSEEFAEAIIRQAQQAAGSRPTPQAPMAAEALGFDKPTSTIAVLTGGIPSEVAGGSEYGSDIYLQFQRPHNNRGYWLLPAANDPDSATMEAGEEWIDDQVAEAVQRG